MNIKQEELDGFQDLFNYIDTAKKGEISLKQANHIWALTGVSVPQESMGDLHSVDCRRFLALTAAHLEDLTAFSAPKASTVLFKMMDVHDSGVVTSEALFGFLKSCGYTSAKTADVESFVELLDQSMDGKDFNHQDLLWFLQQREKEEGRRGRE